MKGVSVTVRCDGPCLDGLIHLCGVVSDDPAWAGIELARAVGWSVVDDPDGTAVYCPDCSKVVAS